MSDTKRFLLTTLANYFDVQNVTIDDESAKSLTDFVHNPRNLLLQCFNVETNSLLLYPEIKSKSEKSLIFYKTSVQDLISSDSARYVNILTLSETPVESLYHILRQIYSPFLIVNNDLLSSKLQQNLSDLESNLRILTHNKLENVKVIISITDEVDFWKNFGQKKDANKKEKDAASSYCDIFQDINEEIRSMESSAIFEIGEAAENVGGLLDDVWRLTILPYTEERMKHTFDIVGHLICAILQKNLSNMNMWKVYSGAKDNEILATLTESVKVIQLWTSACHSLTETYWPNYALHAWSGPPYVPSFCLNFQERLKQIHDIRSTHNQLNKLLSESERQNLLTDRLFEPFENIDVWTCVGSNQEWETAVARFTGNLRPAEAKIAEKIKPRLHYTSTKQLLHEFMRYKTLINRPVVKGVLSSELQIFVTSLDSMLKGIRRQLEGDDTDVKMYQPPEMSSVVQQVQWAKQMEAKVTEIYMCADKYLKEFDGSKDLIRVATQLLNELKNVYTQLHEDWSRDLQAQVKSGALQLSLDKPVVEFSTSTNMMVVHFNPRTVYAAIEARGMTALGLPPPPPATEALDNLSRLVHHARQLKQVASFHNTMGQRMIPSTRPMMLQAALDLSSLVQDQKAVYWNNVEQVANYADKLKNAVKKLEAQNSYLTSQHIAIRNIVFTLMDTELLSKQNEWKTKIKEIRDIIEQVEANNYKNTELWRTHWDWQLYKALEFQYIKTLQSLHTHFPVVKVDLVFRGRTVRLQPPIEEIRVQHYHQLRRFIALPAQFVGLQNTISDEKPSIFNDIVEKHSWMGNKSVAQIESTLSSLERLCVDWTKRAALACLPDLEALCRENLNKPQDWEVNFKACKAYGQAVAKMTFEDEKLDWIIVGTVGLRREFEAQVRNLWACLISSLQGSCREDATNLDSFIANALVTLEDKILPKNAKELAEISAKHYAVREKIPKMEDIVEDLKKKNLMLRTWGGDASIDSTIKEWHKIQELMTSRQQIFEHQSEIVKSSLTGDWQNLNTSVDAWISRWSQTRQRFEETIGVSYEVMMDRCRLVGEAESQWIKLAQDRDYLIKECEKFNVKLDVSDTWKQAEEVITVDVKLWSTLKEYDEEYQALAEQEWIVFQKKLHLIDELVSKWTARLEPYTTITLFLKQELDKYSDLTPLLKYLRGTDFTELHWREVFSLLDMDHMKPDTLQVKHLLNVSLNIKKHIKTLQKISMSASSEAAVRSALSELELWFAGARLTLTYYKDKAQQSTPIVKDFKEILAKTEEQQWVISGIRGREGDAWDGRLRTAHILIRATHHAQRRWLYLEPILSNDDGELGTKFRKVDQGFRQVARILEADPRLSALVQSARLQSMLDSISEQLQACQSALNLYIDEKRSAFPRLYFLSDDDLLELLGQARAGAVGRETVMQTHLKKLFPGITSVNLGPDCMSITALCSHYGETFQLEHPVDIDCAVEIWLKNLESEMRSSIKNVAVKCVVHSLQEQDPFSLPTQILCLTQNIRFTEQAEKAIVSKDLHKLKANIEKENLYYVQSEVEDENERNKRQALILQCAYYLAVIKTLIENNVSSTNHWLWQKQLRFYLQNNKDIVAQMGLAKISYSYEYLGVNTGQFVRTELADECFLILTQALHLGLVGNPFGPAGTGKTESVKALGGLVGRLVLVFNCDEALDTHSMGRLLTGLALSGAWGCFDEFNRLTADTLASVSHQFSGLLTAMTQARQGQNATTTLNGKKVSVSEWCGIAATMNPAGRGYGGRRRLPAALERVLRPVAMMQPKHEELARHLLAARAVTNAEIVADDLCRVFSMASELLSGQRHYDWGLRALKAAIGSCGNALTSKDVSREQLAQKAALRRVLRLNNLSKLTKDDAYRFEAILSMVFADVPEEDTSSNPISSALETTTTTLQLVYNEIQAQKCLDLYEQLQQRMGVVIVGPPGSGKSTIRQLLKATLIQQGKNIVEYVICPKAMSRNSLLGHIDNDTRQWTDGVISATALEVSNQSSDVWSWVVCDGDVDPEWVEALNSVLDDNRLLTLPSGWRIQFGPNVNFIFETHSLEHASPATVSRMGIILLSEENSCAQEMLTSFLAKVEIDNEIARMALPLLQKVINKSMDWFSTHKSDTVIKLYSVSLVKQILTQFEFIFKNIGVSVMNTSPEELVYLAVQRSVVGVLKNSAVKPFQDEMSSLLGPPPIPPQYLGEWRDDYLIIYLSPRLLRYEPAVRAVLTSNNTHLLITGPSACAKNLLAEYVLKDSSSAVMITIDCTPILEPADIIKELKRHNVVGSGAARLGGTLFIRSIHRARIDAWGSSAVHAMLLQIIHHRGFWQVTAANDSSSHVEWCSVPNLRVVATVDPSVASPDVRLASALATVVVDEPEDDELLELINFYLKHSVHKNVQDINLSDTSKQILSMFKEVTETFYSQVHYKWTASNIRQWCDNVKWYSPTNMKELSMALSAESNNIFRDRLVTDAEKFEFKSIVKNYFKDNNSNIYYTPKLRNTGVYLEPVEQKELYQTMQKLINQCLTEQENSVFGDCGAEVCSELGILCPAIARATNGGVVTCVGSAGMARRAAALLISTALPAALIFVNHPSEFNTLVKSALTSAGSDSNRTLIVIAESSVNNATLGSIEALKNARSEYAIPRDMMPSLSQSQPKQQFLDNLKQNLGIVIMLDKNQTNIQDLLTNYPLLYNEDHLLWFERWSEETIREIPKWIIQRLIRENVTSNASDEHDTTPIDGFVNIYNSLETEWAKAPTRYVSFVKAYYYIVKRKKEALLKRRDMLLSGVEALRRARSEVATLQSEAAEQESALSDKQAKANQALDQIGATVRAATDRKEEMYALKKNIELENEKLQVRKKEIEAELASVEPIIAAARAAVGEIRPESLSEVRSLRAPPDVVRDVLEGVLRLMGIADTSWHSMKSFLSKRGVKEDIRCMDASQITPEAVQSVQRLLEKRGSSFEDATARRASAACAPLAGWVRANVAYACALARVRPLQAQQRALITNLQDAENQLTALSSGLATVDERVASLKEQLGTHTRDAAAIELRLTNAAKTIDTAKGLLEQLAHEYSAWEDDLENISKEILELSVRSLLAAAYIVYLPDVTEPRAREQVIKWSELVNFEDRTFSVINFLSTSEKQLKWDADGLPLDKSAIKNAVLIDQILEPQKCGFTPLIIDPDGDAIAWLKNTLAGFSCDFISQHNDKLQTAVHYAVRLGRILVITDVYEIHPIWAPLLRGLQLGGTSATNISFRLLLYSRDETLPNRLSPYHHATLSLIHFTARVDGLTDQLVHHALQQQNPEVNEKAREMKLKKATLQKQQHELQENLLRDLSSNGDILHDQNLLSSLNKTRSSSKVIAESLQTARAIEEQTKAVCYKFQASAERCAILALAVKELTSHRPLVALPVDAVLSVFVEAVKRDGDYDSTVKYVTRRIIERVLLGLHKKDKYIIVLHLLRQVYDDVIPDKLWKLFLGNNDYLDYQKNIVDIKQKYSWIPEECIKRVALLQVTSPELFKQLSLDNAEPWIEFQKSGDLKDVYKLKLNPFENIVAVATMRPESLFRAIVVFVDQILGASVMSGGNETELGAAWGVSRPILLLGAHAADQLAATAAASNVALTQCSIEEGAERWEKGVSSCKAGGGWLAIVVGASPFTDQLRDFLAAIQHDPAADSGSEFRLWIVSEDRDIPPLISNGSVNIVLEAPEGMKNNVTNTLVAWGNYESQELKLIRMHACLAFLHALIQERRAYIPEGWSRWYPFEWGDVSACARAIRASGANEAARGLCEALYGGRVASSTDRALLALLVKECLGEHTNAHAWRPRGTDVQLPFVRQLQSYASAFSSLPNIDSPQILGLPANCRIAWEKKAADNIFTGLKELSTAVSVNRKAGDGSSLRPLLALWKKLMSGNPLIKGEHQNEKLEGDSGWWGGVCMCEMAAARNAVRKLHSALASRARLRPNVPLLTVPEDWQLQWAGPDAPDIYMKELSHRANEAVKRIQRYNGDKEYFPKEVDLRAFLQPRRVIAALRARTAELLLCSPDALSLAAKWDTSDGDKSMESKAAVTIIGARISGARWVGGLVPVTSRDAVDTPAPRITISYIMHKENISEGTFLVPMYDSSSREDLVLMVPGPLAAPLDRTSALLNSVALFIAPV